VNSFDKDTIDFYAAQASLYASVRPDEAAKHLPGFLERLKPGASILELGCGDGIDAEYMIGQGFAVEPTDGVAAMGALAEARLKKPVRIMRFDEIAALEEYDAIVATASLLHTPRDGLADVLQRIWTALRPGGWHIATYKSGGVEGRDDHGRYYNYPSRGNLENVYQQSGNWALIEIDEYIDGGYFGKKGPWLKIITRKPAQP
jgi:SAM-dependent methyltransferase